MIKGVILDLDGTVYIGSKLLPYARETVRELRERGYVILFLTNNSTLSRTLAVRKLSTLGIEADAREVMTSSFAVSQYVSDNWGPSRVLPIGERGLIEELELAGHKIVKDSESAEVVVVGLDREVTYSKLAEAHTALIRSAKFVATNKDTTLPTESGTVPGAGSIVAFLEVSTGLKATPVGKPERYIMDLALRRMGLEREEVILVGDRVDTDIEAARRAGIKALLLVRGHSGPTRLPEVTVIESLSGLLDFLKREDDG
ncbi:MAG: HAD-IIA family hydrolase [Aigarchaeota archaeon]|nr:HAD-IIA family hydrolase [Aigarchaeota archaeon]MDW8092735.1 HAD-IIA family hydrolase [Nitrososphaerota archaeon]